MLRLGLLALVGCGRIGFGASDGSGGAGGDAGGDAATTLDEGLLLHFTFDNDVTTDSGPAAHDATCTSCPLQIGGRIGAGAAMFNGGQCLDVPDASDLRPSAMTAAMWMLADTSAPDGDMFARPYDEATSNADTFELYFASATIEIDVHTGSSGDVRASVDATWRHVAFRVDGANLTLFLDGDAVNGVNNAGLIYAADDLRIGCDVEFGGPTAAFTGGLDDLRMYGRALTDAEVAQLAAM